MQPSLTINPPEERLCVKALAFNLGVSTRFVYEMRRLGFEMDGRHKDNQTATLTQALTWIEDNDFKMARGVGRVQKGSKAHA